MDYTKISSIGCKLVMDVVSNFLSHHFVFEIENLLSNRRTSSKKNNRQGEDIYLLADFEANNDLI